MKLPVLSAERRQFVANTKLTLGYLYFELANFREALHYFESIGSDDPNYAKALLGQAWAAFKLEAYTKALAALEKLLDRNLESDVAEEAQFLLGQCDLKVGRYDDAIAAFKFIVERYGSNGTSIEGLNEIYRQLAEKRATLDELRADLLVLETKLLESIPLETGDGVPDFIKQQHKRIEEARNNLFEQISTERDTFDALRQQIEALQHLTVVREVRKEWGSFAEYGITRALFLKSIQQF